MTVTQTYQFSDLELWLGRHENRNKALIVEAVRDKSRSVMHVFPSGFCADWKPGDGILFCSDGDQYSDEPHNEYLLIEIITF